MIDLMHGKAFRVFTRSYNDIVKDQAIVSDEKIVIFDNNLIYCMNRRKDERRFYAGLSEYANSTAIIAGYTDLFYTEPFALSTLMIAICEQSANVYTNQELCEIVIMMKALFKL